MNEEGSSGVENDSLDHISDDEVISRIYNILDYDDTGLVPLSRVECFFNHSISIIRNSGPSRRCGAYNRTIVRLDRFREMVREFQEDMISYFKRLLRKFIVFSMADICAIYNIYHRSTRNTMNADAMVYLIQMLNMNINTSLNTFTTLEHFNGDFDIDTYIYDNFNEIFGQDFNVHVGSLDAETDDVFEEEIIINFGAFFKRMYKLAFIYDVLPQYNDNENAYEQFWLMLSATFPPPRRQQQAFQNIFDEDVRFERYLAIIYQRLQKKRDDFLEEYPERNTFNGKGYYPTKKNQLNLNHKISINTKLPCMLKESTKTYKDLALATMKKQGIPEEGHVCLEVHEAFKNMTDFDKTIDILAEFNIVLELSSRTTGNFDRSLYRELLLQWLNEKDPMDKSSKESFSNTKNNKNMVDYIIKSIDDRHYPILELPFRFVNKQHVSARRLWAELYVADVIEAYKDSGGVSLKTFPEKYAEYKRNKKRDPRTPGPRISCPNGITERAFLKLQQLIEIATTSKPEDIPVEIRDAAENERMDRLIRMWIMNCFREKVNETVDDEKDANYGKLDHKIVEAYVNEKISKENPEDRPALQEKLRVIIENYRNENRSNPSTGMIFGGLVKVPMRYLPKSLTRKDRIKQRNMLLKSRKMYKTGHKNARYFTRKAVPSFHSKKSNHIVNAERIYGVKTVTPNKQLAKATGCSVDALQQIVRKGEGAYYSSGSRPNQTAQSWGLARLASAITAGKSAAVDYAILEKGCKHNGKAFRKAQTAKKKYGYGQSHSRRVKI